MSNIFGKIERECPILVLTTNSSNTFGEYICEILKAEGINEYKCMPVENLTFDDAQKFNVLVLPETELTQSQVKVLSDCVYEGGNLIALRPDKRIYPVFGIEGTGDVINEGYIKVNNDTLAGCGITGDKMQFHGVSDVYRLTQGKLLAEVFTDDSSSSGFPSVILNKYGKGYAAVFSYNLAKSIILMRQGNPQWARQSRDELVGIRSTDMFYGKNGEPHWLDVSKIHISQADEQMHFFSKIVEELCENSFPLPRLWYFPSNNRCILVFTSDGEEGYVEQFDSELQLVKNHGGTMTMYLKHPYISASQVNKWVSDGHEIAVHYDDSIEAMDPTFEHMKFVYDKMTENHYKIYGIKPSSVRGHWIVWFGWSEHAQIEMEHGIGIDFNYYHVGKWLDKPGNFTGSGLPMKFSNEKGKIIDIYQAVTQAPDEQWGKDNLYGICKTLIDRSIDEGTYTYVIANFHPDRWCWFEQDAHNILHYCGNRGVPVWSGERMLRFVRMRDSAYFSDFCWSDNKLVFKLNTPVQGNNLTFMLPKNVGVISLAAVKKDGVEQVLELMNVKGKDYALISTSSGKSYYIEAFYN